MKKLLSIFFLSCTATLFSGNYDIRVLSNKDGLSNSSVNVVFQDSNELMWFGTWDGLNRYNGKEFRIYKPVAGDDRSISNNIIRDIIEEEKDYLWIATDWGINRMNVREGTFERFFVDSLYREITNEHSYLIAGNSRGEIVASVYQQGIYLFNRALHRFEPLYTDQQLNIRKIILGERDQLWVLTNEKRLYRMDIRMVNQHPAIVKTTPFILQQDVVQIFTCSSCELLVQTSDQQVYQYDDLLQVMRPLQTDNNTGYLNDIGLLEGSVYLATSKGLFRYEVGDKVQPVITGSNILDIYIGTQEIIWAGTDMKGVWKVVPHSEKFQTTLLEEIADGEDQSIGAVRTFLETDASTLWVGTKGSGIFRFTENEHTGTVEYKQQFTTADGLASNAVYAMAEGTGGIYWVGTDGEGLNYFDPVSGHFQQLGLPAALSFSSVYAIQPLADHVLWIGTSGQGMFRLVIDPSSHPYRVTDYRQYLFREGEPSLSNNIVYSIISGGDDHLWIGTRGGGVNRFDLRSGIFEQLRLSEGNAGYYGRDDVISLFHDGENNLWAGTSMGLNRFSLKDDDNPPEVNRFTEEDGLPNNTIHGMLMDDGENLWVSTNNGLAKLIPENGSYRIISYFADDGLQNNEFSDGASYQSRYSRYFYFGGISGFSRFNPLEISHSEYMPSIWMDAFYVDNMESTLAYYLEDRKGEKCLTLSHGIKSFGFSFVPIDYLASSKCEISYMLEGYHREWVNIGTSNTAVFTHLPKGSYLLKVRSSNANKIWGGALFTLPVVITPPWWDSRVAYLMYVLLTAGILYLVRKITLYRMKVADDLKMKEMENRAMEEIHQGKLSFFTNIAHEFSNSLTLIYGPCEKLIEENRGSYLTRKYLQVIRSNAQRMQKLIEQLVEFRKAETGHLQLVPESVDLPELFRYAIDHFLEILEQKKIECTFTSLPEQIIWRTDRESVEKIVFNLLSNAVKYTPEEEQINVMLAREGDRLTITVTNSGVGISPECSERLFDRFEVLNQFEKELTTPRRSRHGIGLALCRSIVQVLKGDIILQSDGVTFTTFVVTLPEMAAASSGETALQIPPGKQGVARVTDLSLQESTTVNRQVEQDPFTNPGEAYILVVEDDHEIRSMISDLLRTDYRVVEASNGKEALELCDRQRPKLVISDILMPVMNGVELVKQMKHAESTRHIPIILLSSQKSIENQIEGFESGADAYIGKPFNIRHLEVLVQSLLQKKTILEDYSNSSYYALDQYEGTLIHKEDKQQIESILHVIYDHLSNEDLCIDFIAKETTISKIQLYRKMKQITGKTPTEFIRSVRLTHAAKLLKTTHGSVKEIMYASGFSNKAYFYREFQKRYSQTPGEYRKDDSES